MQQSKAYVIKNTSRNLKATIPARRAREARLKRIAAIRALELVAYRRFDREG
jgi:RNA polymerase-interacting CarD/CdnL/TRCF family regulator